MLRSWEGPHETDRQFPCLSAGERGDLHIADRRSTEANEGTSSADAGGTREPDGREQRA